MGTLISIKIQQVEKLTARNSDTIMASVRVTPSLSKFIHEAVEFTSNSELITDSKRLSLLKELDNGSISIPNIQLLSKCKRNDSSSPDMKYLLAGSQLQFHKSGPKGSGTSSSTDAYRNVEVSPL